MCVCSLRYPACNAHVPYCHLCPVRLYNIFPHYLINDTIFKKKYWTKKCVLISSKILPETFLILRRTERDMIKNVYWSSCGVPVIFVRFWWSLNSLERISKNRQKVVFLFPLQVLSETFLILRRTERDMIKNVYWSSCRVPVIVVRFWCSLNFSKEFRKNRQKSCFDFLYNFYLKHFSF